MNIKPRELEIVNFGSWKHGKVEFDKQGLVLVVGMVGAGKSTLFSNALRWNLYGSLPRIQADDIINEISGKNTMVKFSFDIHVGKTVIPYEIVRYRKHAEWKNKCVIRENGKRIGEKDSKVDAINELIVRCIGMDEDTFLRTVLFAQRDTNRFPALTDVEQKKWLEQLSEVRVIPATIENTNRRLTEVSSSLSVLVERQSQQEKAIESTKKVVDIQKVKVDDEKSRIRAEINQALTRLEELRADRAAIHKENENLQSKLDKTHKAMREAEAMVEVVEVERKKLVDKLARVTKLKEGAECERCGSVLSTDQITIITTKLRDELEKHIAIVKVKRGEFQAKKKSDSLIQLTRRNLDEQLLEVEKKISKVEEQIKLKKKELHSTEQKVEVKELNETVDHARDDLKETKEYIKLMKRLSGRLKFLLSKGWKVIRANAFQNVLASLESITNQYSRILYGSQLDVKYSIDDEGKIVQRYQSMAGKQRSYSMLSGGEKQLIDITTGLGLREITEVSRVATMDLLILDEPFEGLHQSLLPNVPKLLEQLKKGTVIVVSHREQLAPYFSKIITVQKLHDVSSLK